jgi:predicted dithiol-disulfide oxidoreductase (DUF899 family)
MLDTTRKEPKTMAEHRIGTREEFDAAREQLLAEEKEHTRRADELARKRRELPWVPVEKEYELETADGTKSLAELFDRRSQLLIYHFMFGPSYEAGCPTCSSMVDGFDNLLPHLQARDLTTLLVSRAPLQKLQAYKKRMGWSIPWASSANSDFNFDFGGSFHEEEMREAMPPEDQLPPIAAHNAGATGTDLVSYISEMFGARVFKLQDDVVYETYSTGGRGVEFLMGYYPILDRTPKGRDEGEAFQTWIRRHDEYGTS